jgi:2-dehydropantoate 2-reductase
MRVTIVGTGAMGGLFAAHLASTDIDLWCIDIWQDHVSAIANKGLTIEEGGAVRQVPLKITADPAQPGPSDIVILFTKYGHTEAALRTMAPLLHADTLLVTLQNGIGNVELIQAAFPKHRILFGLTTATCRVVGPGQIWTTGVADTQTHAWPVDGHCDATVKRFSAILNESGIPFFLSSDIEVQIWKKLVVNCAFNTSCALSGMTVGEVTALPQSWPMLLRVADEIVAVGQAKGLPLTQAASRQYLRDVAEAARSHVPSMAADIRAGRATEIDSLTGAVLREAAQRAVATPVVQTLDALVRLIERRQASPD